MIVHSIAGRVFFLSNSQKWNVTHSWVEQCFAQFMSMSNSVLGVLSILLDKSAINCVWTNFRFLHRHRTIELLHKRALIKFPANWVRQRYIQGLCSTPYIVPSARVIISDSYKAHHLSQYTCLFMILLPSHVVIESALHNEWCVIY